MKILLIGPDPYKVKGGMSTVIRDYYESNKEIGCKFIMISTVEDGNKLNKIKNLYKAIKKFLNNIIFKKCKIVHIHVASRKSFFRKSIFIILSKILKCKIIIHMHGGEFNKFYWDESNFLKKFIIRKVLNCADILIALSKRWKEEISKYYSGKIVIINNAIEINEQNLYSKNSKNILFLGRLEKQKGIYDLLSAFKEISKNHENIKLILAGDYKKDDYCKIIDYIDENNLIDNISILGWVNSEEVTKLLRDALIFILPSYNEGMPMSILEAMSFGVPVISTNVGGIPEVFQENNELLICPGDIENIVNLTEKLIGCEEYRVKFSNYNFRKVSNFYNIKENNKKMKIIYKELYSRNILRKN